MKYILSFLTLSVLFTTLKAQNQILVNLVAEKTFGTPKAYDWGASTLDASGNYYTTGHSSAANQTAVLLLEKQTSDGEISWEKTFTPGLNTNAYGICSPLGKRLCHMT